MREILFRGKNCWGKWVEGFYYQAKLRRTDNNLCDYITIPHPKERGVPSDHHIVDSNTIGQYTGLTDKNGKKIFEGDIVKVENVQIGVVEFGKGTFDSGIYCYYGWHIKDIDGFIDHNELYLYDENNIFEVIGNIHDNPELLKGGELNG